MDLDPFIVVLILLLIISIAALVCIRSKCLVLPIIGGTSLGLVSGAFEGGAPNPPNPPRFFRMINPVTFEVACITPNYGTNGYSFKMKDILGSEPSGALSTQFEQWYHRRTQTNNITNRFADQIYGSFIRSPTFNSGTGVPGGAPPPTAMTYATHPYKFCIDNVVPFAIQVVDLPNNKLVLTPLQAYKIHTTMNNWSPYMHLAKIIKTRSDDEYAKIGNATNMYKKCVRGTNILNYELGQVTKRIRAMLDSSVMAYTSRPVVDSIALVNNACYDQYTALTAIRDGVVEYALLKEFFSKYSNSPERNELRDIENGYTKTIDNYTYMVPIDRNFVYTKGITQPPPPAPQRTTRIDPLSVTLGVDAHEEWHKLANIHKALLTELTTTILDTTTDTQQTVETICNRPEVIAHSANMIAQLAIVKPKVEAFLTSINSTLDALQKKMGDESMSGMSSVRPPPKTLLQKLKDNEDPDEAYKSDALKNISTYYYPTTISTPVDGELDSSFKILSQKSVIHSKIVDSELRGMSPLDVWQDVNQHADILRSIVKQDKLISYETLVSETDIQVQPYEVDQLMPSAMLYAMDKLPSGHILDINMHLGAQAMAAVSSDKFKKYTGLYSGNSSINSYHLMIDSQKHTTDINLLQSDIASAYLKHESVSAAILYIPPPDELMFGHIEPVNSSKAVTASIEPLKKLMSADGVLCILSTVDQQDVCINAATSGGLSPHGSPVQLGKQGSRGFEYVANYFTV